MPIAEILSAWSRLALDLPIFHGPLVAGDAAELQSRLGLLPAVTPATVADLSGDDAQRLGLDVFMVDAVVRRHGLALGPDVEERLAVATAVVAERLGCEPILSYPFYIRLNPTDLAEIRRFTPTEAEFRFIRMHRLIEDVFDDLIAMLGKILDAPDRGVALARALPEIADAFRLVNRTVAGFRDPVRMPHQVFFEEFRPYFGPRLDPETGRAVLEGPSGLQSPTFRAVCMLMGYRDPILDGWTRRIGHYHPPATREWLDDLLRQRDAGRCLSAVADSILAPGPSVPHLHPAYGAHIPDLVALARHAGYLTADVLDVLGQFGIELGAWPEGAPELDPLPAISAAPEPVPGSRADLEWLAHLEAMLLAFHVEHVAIAAVQIGYEQGTGGTSGVEFLLLATFRRAFPWFWVSGWGGRFVAEMTERARAD